VARILQKKTILKLNREILENNIVKGRMDIQNNKKGVVLAIVLGVVALMVLSTVSLGVMIQQDVRLIRRVKEVEQAQYVAEAGINHALADIKENGFIARSNFVGNLDTGTYSVTYSTVGGRHLVTSVGTVSGVTSTVSAEIADNTPSALNYFCGAGDDVRINSFIADSEINGDLHANDDIYLYSGFLFAWLDITGSVSATGDVQEGSRHNTGSWDLWDNHVVINGQSNDSAAVFQGAPRIAFPTFDYTAYQDLALDSGDYYSSNTVFSSTTLSPGNGIVYVAGEAQFLGACTINGGVVAEEIIIAGTLTQNKSGTRNVVMAKGGDIEIFGRLYTEEALVYAAQDIVSLQLFAEIEINGLMLARRDIDMWNFLTRIDYNYVYVAPSDMMDEDGERTFQLVSWNS